MLEKTNLKNKLANKGGGNKWNMMLDERLMKYSEILKRLHQRVIANSLVDIEHKELYSKILNGTDLTIRLAQALKDNKHD
jgi:hypothetical protein